MSKFEGVIPALITPFVPDGEVYLEGLENEINYLNLYGYKNIFVGGSYGAFPLLSLHERMVINACAIRLAKMLDMKTIIHIGAASTRDSIILAEHAEDEGADAVSSVFPYYYSHTFYNVENYLRYFEKLINSVKIDVHLYNNPKTTGVNVNITFLKKLIDMGLKGIKDGGVNNERLNDIIGNIDLENFDYYPSSTTSLVTAFMLGIKACVSGVSLCIPEIIMEIYNRIQKEDCNYKNIFKFQKLVLDIRNILGRKTGRAISAYSMLNLNGVDVGTCRDPWIALTNEETKEMINNITRVCNEFCRENKE